MLKEGVLSETARKAIAGIMELAPSITAFGNTNPTSYFRLVPHQEAPTNICWGDRNRSVLVRVPLGWAAKTDMCMTANPLETESHYDTTQKQTVENAITGRIGRSLPTDSRTSCSLPPWF